MTAVVLVCGLGRCGSSLTMQMSHVGGLKVGGIPPYYEGLPAGADITAAWAEEHAGGAWKWLDVHRGSLEAGANVVAVWCDRNVHEMAQSQVKFARIKWKLRGPSSIKPLKMALEADRRASLRILKDVPLHTMWFEKTLKDPQMAAERLAAFLGEHGIELDAEAAASVVRRRSARCAKGLKIEDSMEVV